MSQSPLTSLADIPAARTEWLFEPYLARGKLTLLDGDPSAGKSFVALDLAARLSRGGPLPDGRRLDRPCTTLYFTTEDNAADTLRPRAEAAGADLSRIIVETPGGFAPLVQFPRDASRLWRYILDRRADLVVFDPLVAFLQDGIAAHVDASVRKALTPLAYVAEQCRVGMFLHRHLGKAGGPKALYRGLGSIGLTAASRSELLIAEHPDDPTLRVLSHAKSNGPKGPSLGFRIRPDEQGRHRVVWTGPVDLTADELCARRESLARRPRERAAEWLRGQLANGPRKAADLVAAAAKLGIAERTLDRVKRDLRIQSEQTWTGGRSEWIWFDPRTRNANNGQVELPPLTPLQPGLEACVSLDDVMDHLRNGTRG